MSPTPKVETDRTGFGSVGPMERMSASGIASVSACPISSLDSNSRTTVESRRACTSPRSTAPDRRSIRTLDPGSRSCSSWGRSRVCGSIEVTRRGAHPLLNSSPTRNRITIGTSGLVRDQTAMCWASHTCTAREFTPVVRFGKRRIAGSESSRLMGEPRKCSHSVRSRNRGCPDRKDLPSRNGCSLLCSAILGCRNRAKRRASVHGRPTPGDRSSAFPEIRDRERTI